MKRCPSCTRTYTDPSLNFCLEDGTPLVADTASSNMAATMSAPQPRDTEPPPTEIYRPTTPLSAQAMPQPQARPWAPTPLPPPQKKSNAVWWVLGGVVVVGIFGVGLIVVVVLIASLGSSNNNGNTSNSNIRIVNRNVNNTNTSNSNTTNTNANTNTSTTPASLADDFSVVKWGTGDSKYGNIWYANDEYHMRSKKDTYLVMYAPGKNYETENATVKVTARSVDGSVPAAGFGLVVYGEQSKTKGLEDYAFLIYPGAQPEYEVVMHKDGTQTSLVTRTASKVIRSGTNPNQLEVRTKANELQFYINGQYINRIDDSANFKRGLAGLYTSDSTEVAFDDLEISH